MSYGLVFYTMVSALILWGYGRRCAIMHLTWPWENIPDYVLDSLPPSAEAHKVGSLRDLNIVWLIIGSFVLLPLLVLGFAALIAVATDKIEDPADVILATVFMVSVVAIPAAGRLYQYVNMILVARLILRTTDNDPSQVPTSWPYFGVYGTFLLGLAVLTLPIFWLSLFISYSSNVGFNTRNSNEIVPKRISRITDRLINGGIQK